MAGGHFVSESLGFGHVIGLRGAARESENSPVVCEKSPSLSLSSLKTTLMCSLFFIPFSCERVRVCVCECVCV